jgi:formylglycine-generating enzyme required for sulfatase activity
MKVNRKAFLTLITLISMATISFSQTLPGSITMKSITGGTFTMGSNSILGSPDQQVAAPEHSVTLSSYLMSEAEISNVQYVEFLNSAYTDGLIEINIGALGPDSGKRLIQGSASSSYQGKTLYNMDGIRVLKDHNNGDGDGNPFTGTVEPENPLNISYIGFDSITSTFYVKDPHNVNDFHWLNICNYYNYGTTPMMITGPVLNDFDDWAGIGQNLSDELQGWTDTLPSSAVNLPDQAEISGWPVTFIRWWGAFAFADYYNVNIPSEAQWEYAAKGGNNYLYAVHNGVDITDANWNQAGDTTATGHVRSAISGTANPFGLYNLGGNSWEWIADNYIAPYDTNAVTDPLIEVANSTSRCWRGGSWNYHEATLQTAIRFYDEEDRGNDHFGFRIVTSNLTVSNAEADAKDAITVYPNPGTKIIHFELLHPDETTITIFTTGGKTILNQSVSASFSLDVSDWTKGIYFARIGLFTKKLIVK